MKFMGMALALLVAAPVSAQDVGPTPETPLASAPPVPEAVPALAASYEARVLYGLRQVILRDFDGAVATLRAAAQAEPGMPAAYCHLGDAQLEKGDLVEARAAYESCARFARLANVARSMSVAYVGIARAVERTPDTSMTERREAWARARDGAGDDLARALATSRLSAYDAAQAREAAYEPVRKRSAEREAASQARGGL